MNDTLTFADEQNWFIVIEPASGVFGIHEPLHYLDVRSYLVTGSERAMLVDTGTGVGNLRNIVDSITALPVTVVNSHARWDHIGADILNGRQPEEVGEDRAIHHFDGFAICVPPDYRGRPAR